MSGPLLKDAHWVRQSFLVKKDQLSDVDFQNRTFTTASLKFTDTAPGGNFSVNPLPQFTRFADIRSQGRFTRNRTSGKTAGMGRYYSEAIDDNQQVIHMRFGVPQFNSLTTFFTGFYNSSAGQLARTGRTTDLFYAIGRVAGFVVSVAAWPILAFQLLGVGARFFGSAPSSKFYYLKPTMPLYWGAVNTIVNHIAVNRGIVPRMFSSDDVSKERGNEMYTFGADDLKRLAQMMPDIFNEGGGVDVYALANRAQRLAEKHHQRMQKELGDANNLSQSDLSSKLHGLMQEDIRDDGSNYRAYLQKWLDTGAAAPSGGGSTTGVESRPEEPSAVSSYASKMYDFFVAEMQDGAAFASFRVDATGQISESFSNSVTESDIANKINSTSSQSRSSSFSFANGNIGGTGGLVEGVMGAAADFLKGATDQLGISGLAALAGSAFVDIPKHWQSSQASLPRANYSIKLVSPYGNPISQLLNIHIPLAMLLAGALPLSTGKQSYTSPFILELYDRGRCQTRLGMIDSLSITRGTGNMGFSNEGQVMAIDVTFSVVDMSSVLHMPLSEGVSMLRTLTAGAAGFIAGGVVGGAAGAAVANGIFDDDTVFTDYMAVLSGLNLADQIYPLRKLKLNMTRTMAEWKSYFSVSHFMAVAADSSLLTGGHVLQALFRDTSR